ncbi:MAG: M13 family peptidase [Bacteroidetes bacterium]|nr:MAG: M13 family peptidase [Bacteroidota bacterium]
MRKIFLSALTAFALVSANSPETQAQGIDKKNMDLSVKPQDDFYRYVNGSWLKNTEIPASESVWGSFSEIDEFNRKTLKAILEESLTKRKSVKKGDNWQLIGDLYASGMDSLAIEKAGAEPLKQYFAEVDAIKTPEDIVKLIATFQKASIRTPFGFFVGADSKNSNENALYLGQGGTSLPDRSYYFDDRFAEIREKYLTHLTNMFVLAGEAKEVAEKSAKTVLKIETRLAEAQRTRVDGRDPVKRYNKRTIEELNQSTFNINWTKYFEMVGIKNAEWAIVGAPEFLCMVDRMLKDVSANDWKTYFRWRVIGSAAPFLSHAFVKESFSFFSTTLNGVKQMQPRWKRVQGWVDGSVGEALGQIYIERTFPKEAKARMIEMIENIREAFAERIQKYTWMSEETKQEALTKLKAITCKIGYPDKWEDYTGLDLRDGDLIGNMRRLNERNYARMIEQFGKPVDKTEWGMTPPTVNAYYNPLNNEIAFPAGILRPPFFDFKADDAVNYGGIGAVIGHEITHGFDDQGSQYDAKGNLRMWWTKDDRSKFEANANMIVEQYDAYKVFVNKDSVAVNGKLTLGENIADLGGLTIAYAALQKSYAKKGKPKKIDGFTGEQRFFMGWAQVWRIKHRDEALLNRIKTDSHAPGEYRANGAISNMPAFFEAFGVKEGDKMRRKPNRLIVIW